MLSAFFFLSIRHTVMKRREDGDELLDAVGMDFGHLAIGLEIFDRGHRLRAGSDTLAALHVNPETGLTHAEVDARRKEHGYNEVAEQKGHPVLMFLGKFWGLSAWMLELIMVLSAVLGKYSDLAVVGALLVVNAVLSFMQEHRAAGVVETLRRRLQVSARVRREASWQVIPARDLVPGDIVRVRPGDIIPGGRQAPDRSVER